MVVFCCHLGCDKTKEKRTEKGTVKIVIHLRGCQMTPDRQPACFQLCHKLKDEDNLERRPLVLIYNMTYIRIYVRIYDRILDMI